MMNHLYRTVPSLGSLPDCDSSPELSPHWEYVHQSMKTQKTQPALTHEMLDLLCLKAHTQRAFLAGLNPG